MDAIIPIQKKTDTSKMAFTLGCHLVVVVELVCLNDPESFTGGDFGPWQV